MKYNRHNAWHVLSLLGLALLALPALAQRSRRAVPKRAAAVVAMPPAAAQWADTLSVASAEARAKAYALYLEAIVQREQGQQDAAYELLTQAVCLNPRLAAAYLLLAPLTAQLYPDSPERVTLLLERAVALAPRTKDYLHALADQYASIQTYDKALQYYEQLVAFGGHTLPYLERIYTLQATSEQYEAALATLENMERINGSSDSFIEQRIKLYNAMGNRTRVEQLMDSLIASAPDRVDYLGYKAQYYYETDRPEEALRLVAVGLEKDSQNTRLNRLRAAAYLALGDTLRSHEALYESFMPPHEFSPELLIPMLRYSIANPESNLSKVLLRVFHDRLPHEEDKQAIGALYTGYLEAAVEDSLALRTHLRHIIKHSPTATRPRLMLLREFLRDTTSAEAMVLCDEGIRYTPSNPVFYFYKAVFYTQAADCVAALDILRKGQAYLSDTTLEATFVSNYYEVLGGLYYRQGQAKRAWPMLDSALVYNGDNALALNNYAFYLYLDKQRISQAKQMAQKAVELEPNNYYYIDTYAKILLRIGERAEAQLLIERALPEATSEAEGGALIWELAGDLAYQAGQKTEALHYWQEAQKMGSHSVLLPKKISRKRYFHQSKKEALNH